MDIFQEPITLTHLEQFKAKKGPKALNNLLSFLSKKQKFYEQINTELGQALFYKITERFEDLLSKIADDTATSEEKMEFRITKNLLSNWAGEMEHYSNAKRKLQGKD